MGEQDVLKGIGVSGGEGVGQLIDWVEMTPTDFVGRVVLLNELDDRVASLVEASGIVSLRGGITSHGAVLARELQIPCVVVSEPEAIKSLLGHQVVVDGWDGTIKQTERLS
jgi:pyruvate,water dikinase